MTYNLDTIIEDLETIFNKTVDPKVDITPTPGDPPEDPPLPLTHPLLWPGGVKTGAKNKPSLQNGPILLMGLVIPKITEGMDYGSTADIKVVLAGLIQGRSSTSKKKAYHYGDVMLDEIRAIRDGYREDWSIKGFDITIPDNNPVQFSEFKLNENAEKPECSGFAMYFTIKKNDERVQY